MSKKTYIQFIELDAIAVEEGKNYRGDYDESKLKDLKSSFVSWHDQTDGKTWMLQPVVVHRVSPSKFVPIAGFRRILACRQLVEEGYEWAGEIPAKVISRQQYEQLGTTGTILLTLTENEQREEVSPVDTAHALKDALDSDPELSQIKLAEKLGKAKSWVAYRIGLLRLDDTVQQALRNEDITFTFARDLGPLDKEKQREILDKVLNLQESVSVKRLRNLVKAVKYGEDDVEAAFDIADNTSAVNRLKRAHKVKSEKAKLEEEIEKRQEAIKKAQEVGEEPPEFDDDLEEQLEELSAKEAELEEEIKAKNKPKKTKAKKKKKKKKKEAEADKEDAEQTDERAAPEEDDRTEEERIQLNVGALDAVQKHFARTFNADTVADANDGLEEDLERLNNSYEALNVPDYSGRATDLKKAMLLGMRACLHQMLDEDMQGDLDFERAWDELLSVQGKKMYHLKHLEHRKPKGE